MNTDEHPATAGFYQCSSGFICGSNPIDFPVALAENQLPLNQTLPRGGQHRDRFDSSLSLAVCCFSFSAAGCSGRATWPAKIG
jgi:hypothetical protein